MGGREQDHGRVLIIRRYGILPGGGRILCHYSSLCAHYQNLARYHLMTHIREQAITSILSRLQISRDRLQGPPTLSQILDALVLSSVHKAEVLCDKMSAGVVP